jgi:methanesulfonate monooxygenase large subunit
MRPGTQTRTILHGRVEDSTIHDEVGMRHFYEEWARRMGRSPLDPSKPYGMAAE